MWILDDGDEDVVLSGGMQLDVHCRRIQRKKFG